MIIGCSGVMLIPGNGGEDCPGNGEDTLFECCCDECDYYLCCFDDDVANCDQCNDKACPRASH